MATAIVDAIPKSLNLNAVSIVYNVKVDDAYPGPPCVITNGISKCCNVPLIQSNKTKSITSAIEGNCIARSLCREFAPSISAASNNSGDTDFKPEINKIT